MHFQFGITPNIATPPALPAPLPDSVPELLRLILDGQREQLQHLVALQQEQLDHIRAARQEHLARAHHILGRWSEEFPQFAEHCQRAYPRMERAYVQLLANMVEELAQHDDDFDNEFAVQDFIDRNAMRLGQLQHLLGIVGPIAEAAHQVEEAQKPQG